MEPNSPIGFQPRSRSASGRLINHATGCWVNGGAGLRPGVCKKCKDDTADDAIRSLMRSDRKDYRKDKTVTDDGSIEGRFEELLHRMDRRAS